MGKGGRRTSQFVDKVTLVPVEERPATVEEIPELGCVGQVAIVNQIDAERGVDKEWLGLL